MSDYYDPNARAIGNLNTIAQSLMPLFDPRVRAQAEEFRQNKTLFPLKYQQLQADLGLTNARTATEGYQQRHYQADTDYIGSKRSGQDLQNRANSLLFQSAVPSRSTGGPLPLPNQQTGVMPLPPELLTESDRVGHPVYVTGPDTPMQGPIPGPNEASDALLPSLNPQQQSILAGVAGQNPVQFVEGQARAQALQGGFDENRAREIALAQGQMPSLSTAFTAPYQQKVIGQNNAADYQKGTDIARINGQSGLAETDLRGRYGLADTIVGAQMRGGPNGKPLSVEDAQKINQEAATLSFQNFGVPPSADGKGYDLSKDPFRLQRERWASTVSQLLQNGMDPWQAKAQANLHHFGTADPVGSGVINSSDGWFSSPKISKFNPSQMDIPQRGGMPVQAGSTGIGGVLQALGLGGSPQPTKPAPQAGPIPPMLAAMPEPASSGPIPTGTDLGQRTRDEATARQREMDRNYNLKTLQRVGLATQQNNSIPMQDILRTVFSGDPQAVNAIYQEMERLGSQGRGTTFALPNLRDLQNAFSDDEALRAWGANPSDYYPYRSQRVQQPAPAPANVDALLQKYR